MGEKEGNKMQKTLKISFALLFILAVTFAVLTAFQTVTIATVSAQESGEVQEESAEEVSSDYTYVAQPGDTYTQIARKAIQTYGVNDNVNLTPAGIVYAETNLTQEAGSEELAEGQEVSIDGELVKKWVEAAEKLSEAEQAAWDIYVPFVNFNTDNIGQ